MDPFKEEASQAPGSWILLTPEVRMLPAGSPPAPAVPGASSVRDETKAFAVEGQRMAGWSRGEHEQGREGGGGGREGRQIPLLLSRSWQELCAGPATVRFRNNFSQQKLMEIIGNNSLL